MLALREHTCQSTALVVFVRSVRMAVIRFVNRHLWAIVIVAGFLQKHGAPGQRNACQQRQ